MIKGDITMVPKYFKSCNYIKKIKNFRKRRNPYLISIIFLLSVVTIFNISTTETIALSPDNYLFTSQNQVEQNYNYNINQIDPFSDVYKDLNINRNDNILSLNKPNLVSNSSSSDRWVDEFDTKTLNNIWNNYGSGFNYSLIDGNFVGSLTASSYNFLYLNTPDFTGDFEIESKIAISSLPSNGFSIIAWNRENGVSFPQNQYLYLGYWYAYTNNITMSKFLSSSGSTITKSVNATKLVNEGIYLKLVYIASNTTFIGYYSFDLSSTWTYLGSITGLTINKFNIGIYSGSGLGSTTVSYDYFSLKSDQSVHLLQTLRDNINDYDQVWEPWITKAAVHKSAVSDSGDLLVVAGGYLLDTSLHIYRWDYYQRKYVKAFEAGAGVINGDVYDLALGDTDNNRLMEVAAASADGHVYLFEQNHIYDPNTNLESKFDLVWKSGVELTKQASTVDIFDADLDSLPDVIVGSYDKKIHMYEYYNHTGYPFASVEHKIDLAEKYVSPELDDVILSLASGDFNNNGLPDFIVGTRSGSVYIFENAGLVVDVRGTPTLLPWDNNYKIIANFSSLNKPLWYPVTKIETGPIDSKPGDEAILLVWGQGTYMVSYSFSEGFYFEQLIYPFQDWETKLPYSLDNFADWIQKGSTQNVWHNINGTVVNEPVCCDVELNTNSASGYAPDNKYSHYTPSSTQNASAIYELWAGEYLATSGNSDPDLYIILNKAQNVLLSSWTISVSQNGETWYTIDKIYYSTSIGSTGKTLNVDLDFTFAVNKLSYIKFIKLTLDKGSSEQQVDAIYYPRAYRPLTTTTSLMIKPLKLDLNDNLVDNKILFGTTDGRFLAYKYEQDSSKFVYQTFTGATLESNYSIIPGTFLEVWDSFEDDNYNLKTTIWDVFYTPKGTIIPSWRYNANSPNSVDFTITQFGDWNTTNANVRLHSFDIYTVYPYSLNGQVVVTTNNSDDNAEKILLISSETGTREKIGVNNFDLSHYFFDPITSYYNKSNIVNELLTVSFGDISSNTYDQELLIFPWYQSGRPFLTGSPLTLSDYPSVTPRIFSRDYYFYNFSLDTAIDTYIDTNYLTAFKTFIINSNTFPSGKIVDLNNDGLQDIIVSNGTLAVLWNTGNTSIPHFTFDYAYFTEINNDLVDTTIFQPQAWDYDNDGDYDIGFSYGQHSGDPVWGFDFFEQTGNNSLGNIFWSRNIQIVENPSKDGSLISNHYKLGVIIPSSSCKTGSIYSTCTTGDSFWVYSPDETPGLGFKQRLRKLEADTTSQTSFIVGTNPYVMKIEANRFQDPPNSINMGYATTISWSNMNEVQDWTQALGTTDIDNDGRKEVIAGDYDNNVYAFEHLSNNTYKIAFKSNDLNHTESTNLSPYLFEDLAGISGNFSRIIYDHINFIATGVDFNNDGINGFVASSGNTIYVYEGTGYNDEIKLFLQFDIGKLFDKIAGFDPKTEKVTALAVTKDFDGRGSMIAVAINNKLFLFRLDSKLGLVESFQFISKGTGYQLPGNPFVYPKLIIQSLMFADMNKDGITELWIAGLNQTSGNNGLLLALASNNAGNIFLAYNFDTNNPTFTNGKSINVLTTSDIDIDGNLELVIGHSLGVDIYEFSTNKALQATRLDTITSDSSYASLYGINASLFDGIVDVTALTVGDTDLDLRSEIIIGHDLRISVLEAYQDLTGKIFHKQVWISLPFRDKPNSIQVDDVNGNNWPEIFVAVKGDDVYAFENSLTDQPKASSNYLTGLVQFMSYNASKSDFISFDTLYLDRDNNGVEDTYIFTDSRINGDINGKGGIIAWDINTNSLLWKTADPFGKSSQYLHLFENGNTKRIIVLSTGGIYSVGLNGNIIYSKTGMSDSLYGSFVFTDINSDSLEDLVIGFKNSNSMTLKGINAINLETGLSLWSTPLTLNEHVSKSFYDLKFNQINNSKMFVVSVSNFTIEKKFYFFNEKGNLLYSHAADHIDSSATVSQSALGDFNGDNNFEIATATTDTNYNKVQVRTIETFNIFFDMNLKDLGGSIWSRIPIFALNVNNDSRDNLILSFARFNSSDTSSQLYDPTRYNNGLIVALDVSIPVVLWEREIFDSITNIETIKYHNRTNLIVYTENLGVLGIAIDGADSFWSQGGVFPVSFSLSGNKILVSTLNGFLYNSEFKGLVRRADNFVTPRPNINKNLNADLYSSDNLVKIISLDIFNKGSDELLFAYANGTINLIDYRLGELMTINLSPFTKITANTIQFDINKYGFIIKTDTSNFLIFDVTSNQPKRIIKSPGPLIGDIITFDLTGDQIDAFLIQTNSSYGYMLSIYDLKSNLYSWNRTYANQLIWTDIGSFDGSDPSKITHIIALDDNGVAKLIELPNINLPGGAFINPDIGRWTRLRTTKNSNQLTDVYLGSDKGQIFKFSWDLQGNYKVTKYNSEPIATPTVPNLLITEIMHHPPTGYSVDADWIELYNPTNGAFSLNGWYVRNINSANKFYLSGTITAGGYIVIARDKVAFKNMYGFYPDLEWKNDVPNLALSDSNEGVYVYSGSTFITGEAFGWAGLPNQFDITAIGSTLVRNTTEYFGYTNGHAINSGTLGTPKNGPYHQKILFSEVYFNTKYQKIDDKYEWIELYNPTGNDIDLAGWSIKSDFNGLSIPLSGTIKSNGYFVIAKNSDQFKSIYGFTPDLTFGSYLSSLNNNGDKLTLYSKESVNLDEVGWANYKSLAISNINANEESIARKSIVDTNTASDFIQTGGFGNPGFGRYIQSSMLIELSKGLNSEVVLLYENTNESFRVINDFNQIFTSILIPKTELARTYENSIITNINGGPQEVLIPLGNSILIISTNGSDIELYSFTSSVKRIINWNIDKVDKYTFVVELDNGKTVLVDPAFRKSSCYFDKNYCSTTSQSNSNNNIIGLGKENLKEIYLKNTDLTINKKFIDYLNIKNTLIGVLIAIPTIILFSGLQYNKHLNKKTKSRKEEK